MFVTVTFDEATFKPAAIELATFLTNVASVASDAPVTFSGKLPKPKVSADLMVYCVTFSMRVVVGAAVVTLPVGAGAGAAVVAGAAVDVVVTSGSHLGRDDDQTPAYGELYLHAKYEELTKGWKPIPHIKSTEPPTLTPVRLDR